MAVVLATIEGMIAVVWHFWLGLILLVVGGLAVVQLIVGYVAKVSAMKYPNRRQRNAQKKLRGADAFAPFSRSVTADGGPVVGQVHVRPNCSIG